MIPCRRATPLFISALQDCDKIIAGDETVLRELLHPEKADLNIGYSLAHAVLKPGHASLPHSMRTSEVYYILQGTGIMHIDDETSHIRASQAIYIPPGSKQYIDNTGDTDLVFLCIVDPAWQKSDEEIVK